MVDQSAPDSIGLCISMMGKFSLWLGSSEIPIAAFSRRKALQLLKLITLQPGQQLHRDQVLEQLWPHLAPRSALAQFYKAVHYVRQAMAVADPSYPPDSLFQSQNQLLRLSAPGGVHTDVSTFEQLAKEAVRTQELSLVQRAITAYKGDLLPDDLYEEWTIVPRNTLKERFLDLLLLAGRVYREAGYFSEAGNSLRKALRQDETREDIHRALMHLYALQGSRVRALRRYKRCSDFLAQGLDVEPAPETTALYDKIRRGDVQPQHSDYPMASLEMPSLPPLIGRDSELAVLKNLLQGLDQGKGSVVGLDGGAGIGKTRLAQEILQIDEQKRQVYLGGTHEQEGQIPYMPFIEVLRKAIRSDPRDAHLIPAELAVAIPELPESSASIEIVDQLAAQSALFAAVQRFTAARASRSPLILIVDDLHAADSGSLRLFHYLARQTKHTPFVLIGIWRTFDRWTNSTLKEIIKNLVRQGMLQRLTLTSLSRADHRFLLEQTLEGSELKSSVLDSALADKIYLLSVGNPLFAIEMVRQLTAEGIFDRLENWEPLTNIETRSEPTPALPLPPSAQTLVDRRLESLSAGTVDMLRFAAVAGHDFLLALLEEWGNRRNLGKPDLLLWDSVDEAIAADLLHEVGSSGRFAHPLFRQVIYQQMTEGRRRVLHGEVAVAMEHINEAGAAVAVEQIAFHYVRAGNVERAVSYLLKSAKRAEAVYDHDSALNRCKEAISLLQERSGAEAAQRRAEIYEQIGDIQRAVGNVVQSLDAYRRALEQVETVAAARQQLTLHRKITLAAVLTPDIPTAAKHLEQAWSFLEEDDLERARMLITQALFDWHANDLEAAIDHASQALEIAEQTGATIEASQACEMLAMAHFPLGNWEEGLQYELQCQTADWSPEIVVAVDAHLCLYQFRLQGKEPYRHVKQFIETIGEQSATSGNLRCLAVCHYALGSLALLQGRPRMAFQSLSTALELHERIGSPAAASYTLARQIELLTIAGATKAGWDLVPSALEQAQQAALRDHCLMLVHTASIRNRLAASDFTAAREMVEAAEKHDAEAAPCSICSVERHAAIARFYYMTGEADQARHHAEQALQLAYANSLGKARALRIQAQLYAAQGDTEQAESCISQAATIFREVDSRFDLASTLQTWADLPASDADDAQELQKIRREESERLYRQFQTDLVTQHR